MKKRCAILWLRNDLRLHDHEALNLLAETMDQLLPVYCFDPRDFERQPLGFPRIGALRARFLVESLEDLRAALRARGSDLHVALGAPEVVIARLARDCGAAVVFAERQMLGPAVELERRLVAALEPLGVPLRSYWVNTLTHPNDLPFPIANLPERFDQFHLTVERAAEPRLPLSPPHRLPAFPAGISGDSLPTLLQAMGLSATVFADVSHVPRGGESTALARLEDYVQGRRASLATRRGGAGDPDLARSDIFGPWLACGALSPRQIYQYVRYSGLEAWADELATGLLDELLYRDYCRLRVLKRGVQVARVAEPGGENDAAAGERFACWQQGATGEPFVDAHLRELAWSGRLDGFGRRLVASYLCHDLHLDWRWGAAWFAAQLLDDDPCVNLALWLEVTGLWHIAEPAIRLDPVAEAARRDPQGRYRHYWLGDEARALRRAG